MKIFHKIEAQAMQFAILVSVLVALLLGAFLMLTHVHSFFNIKSKEIITAFEKSNQQLFVSLDTDNIVRNDTIIKTDNTGSSKLNVVYHGAWIRRYSEIQTHNQKVSKIALTGSKKTESSPNLYVKDNNSPLVLVGDARLEGNTYLPKQGVKAGNISGHYYQGNTLYYGRSFVSKTTLPKFDSDWVAYLKKITQGALLATIDQIPLQDEHKNSFHAPAQLIYDIDPIVLDDQTISGNIIIQSQSQIIIGPNAQLTDVICIAPKITVSNSFKGRFQGIANRKIEIGKACYLSYPSALILIDERKKTDQQPRNTQHHDPEVTIGTQSIIEGGLAYIKPNIDTKQNRIQTNVEIAKGVEVVGEVYCDGNMDFQGTVLGALYSNQFIARQSGSIYLNHIYNGKVLLNPIENYAGLPFANQKSDIVQWLY
ncbi:hypothetical protein [Aquimarina algicola]|uniref:Uncharacterized protein n=1 Tax=Aquimarina algicola TaxID=2589995 RepID=A0A504JIJ9_9FLAO|nr:hypothetical protein [Aquimarina algicola]TPN87678.1 hypothetical protein FHK87_08870 [Aquimarina algicola]